VFDAGYPEGPVGRDQREGIPALSAPDAAGVRGLLQHDVLAPVVLQMVAHRQPGLPAAMITVSICSIVSVSCIAIPPRWRSSRSAPYLRPSPLPALRLFRAPSVATIRRLLPPTTAQPRRPSLGRTRR